MCSLSAFVAIDGWWLRAVVLGAGAVGIAWVQWRVPTRADTVLGPLPPVSRWFRVAAFAEAATWLGLLVGMAVKYVGSGSEAGVRLFGPIHGVVVLGYVAAVLVAARQLHWGGRTTALGLLASVPPLATLVFEAWATQTGRLGATHPPPTRSQERSVNEVSSGRRWTP